MMLLVYNRESKSVFLKFDDDHFLFQFTSIQIFNYILQTCPFQKHNH